MILLFYYLKTVTVQKMTTNLQEKQRKLLIIYCVVLQGKKYILRKFLSYFYTVVSFVCIIILHNVKNTQK